MEKVQVLAKKYEVLIKEWNQISLAIAIYFSACTLGLAFALVFGSFIASVVMLTMMAAFAWFEYRTRKNYVSSREKLEKEIFKTVKAERVRIDEIVRKGFFW